MVNTQNHDLDLIFQALSDSTRRAILMSLMERERPIKEVAEPFKMSLAAVSKHFKVLEKAGLVQRRREGSYSYMSVNGEALRSADQWIELYRRHWEGQLLSLKNFLESEPEE